MLVKKVEWNCSSRILFICSSSLNKWKKSDIFLLFGCSNSYAFFIKFHIPIDLWYLNFTTYITLRAWIIPINTYFSLWLSSLDLSWSGTCIYTMLPNKHKWEIVGFFELQACYVVFFLVQSLCETRISQIDCMSGFIPKFFGHSHAL